MTSGIWPTLATIHRVSLVQGTERRRPGRGVQRPAAGVLTSRARVVGSRVVERAECCQPTLWRVSQLLRPHPQLAIGAVFKAAQAGLALH